MRFKSLTLRYVVPGTKGDVCIHFGISHQKGRDLRANGSKMARGFKFPISGGMEIELVLFRCVNTCGVGNRFSRLGS